MGKTVLTASLLFHLRQTGVNALAMKPFCSGGTADVDLIQAIQGRIPSRDEINPYYFADPVSPLVAARKVGQKIQLPEVLKHIRAMQRRCDCLVIEGAGGLLVPIGEDFTIADLIVRLQCDTLVVGRNKLGTINHTLLTVEALRARRVKRIKVVLMAQKTVDPSVQSNATILHETLDNIEVLVIPHLGAGASRLASVKQSAKKIKKVLVRVLDFDIVCPRSLER